MDGLDQILQEIASASVSASADDLPALGQIHSLFEALAAALPSGDARFVAASGACGDAQQLLEKLILRETADAEESLRRIGKTTEDLLSLLSDAAAGPGVDPPPPLAPSIVQTHGVTLDSIDPQDAALILEFVQEAGEHIEASEAALLKLDQDASDLEAVNQLFRAFHTIKGVAGFLKLGQIGALAHAVENLMDLARGGALRLDASAIDALLRSVDLMKGMMSGLDAAVKGGTNPAVEAALPPLLAALQACAGSGSASAVTSAPERAQGMAPGAAASSLHDRTATPASPSAGEAAVPAARVSAATEAPPTSEPPAKLPAVDRATEANAQSSVPAASPDSVVKVSTERLDSLINAIGELVIAQTMVRQDVLSLAPTNPRVLRTLNQVTKIARELQDLSMSMRMVPIQGVFQKMSRLARDLSRKCGKEFELEILGGDTELDRGLVEAISDPLVHMVRNSADHGLEPADERENAGKPRCGRIQLRAYHQAGNVVVEISDDGRGLNKAKLLKKAQDRGIVPPGKELSEEETFKLVFAAGLSTADKVTDVSGRGVGMDVVRRNVESLRGRIEIASREGVGSTFTIRLPLTLAVIDGLVVRVGEERFIIPIISIEQSLRPQPAQVSTIQNRGEVCMVRDQLVPIVRLHRFFDIPAQHRLPGDGLLVIVQSGTQRCCLMVDELLGQQQVVIKSLGAGVGQPRGVSGGAILGDGNVSLILDVSEIVAAASCL